MEYLQQYKRFRKEFLYSFAMILLLKTHAECNNVVKPTISILYIDLLYNIYFISSYSSQRLSDSKIRRYKNLG